MYVAIIWSYFFFNKHEFYGYMIELQITKDPFFLIWLFHQCFERFEIRADWSWKINKFGKQSANFNTCGIWTSIKHKENSLAYEPWSAHSPPQLSCHAERLQGQESKHRPANDQARNVEHPCCFDVRETKTDNIMKTCCNNYMFETLFLTCHYFFWTERHDMLHVSYAPALGPRPNSHRSPDIHIPKPENPSWPSYQPLGWYLPLTWDLKVQDLVAFPTICWRVKTWPKNPSQSISMALKRTWKIPQTN